MWEGKGNIGKGSSREGGKENRKGKGKGTGKGKRK